MPQRSTQQNPLALRQIWAPWRLEYIKAPREGGCFLCRAFRARRDRARGVIFRGRRCAVLLNRYPYTGGHLMIAPLRHTHSILSMTPSELNELMALTRRAIGWLEKSIQPHGFNVGFNLGEAAGAGLKDHAHLHIVPRWRGDTNFMPVLGRTNVVPISLDQLWELLHAVATGKPRRSRK